MKHKAMIYIPLVLLIGATIALAISVFNEKNTNHIIIPTVLQNIAPVTPDEPSPFPTVEATPTPIDPAVQITSDLNSILQDVSKLKVEDTRFKPPVFVFDMGI